MQFSWVDAVTTWPTLKSVEFALFLSFLEIIRITDHTSFVIIFLGPEGAPVCSMQDSECVRNSQSTQGKIIGDTGNPTQRNATQRKATQRNATQRSATAGPLQSDKLKTIKKATPYLFSFNFAISIWALIQGQNGLTSGFKTYTERHLILVTKAATEETKVRIESENMCMYDACLHFLSASTLARRQRILPE